MLLDRRNRCSAQRLVRCEPEVVVRRERHDLATVDDDVRALRAAQHPRDSPAMSRIEPSELVVEEIENGHRGGPYTRSLDADRIRIRSSYFPMQNRANSASRT